MAAPAAPATPPGGFNKMFVMLPVMFLARKLDGENPDTIQKVRLAYAVVQISCVAVVLYVYVVASAVTSATAVFVPPAASPFTDPNAKKKYTQIPYGAHVKSTARSLLGSTLFGIAMTCVLHYYRGMLMGLAIQVVMAPFGLWENPLVRSILKGIALSPENTVFDEKLTITDLGDDAEVVDEQGHAIAGSSIADVTTEQLKSILLDTWDAATKADIPKLLSYLNKENINTTTDPDHWTATMILCGLKQAKASAIKSCIEKGAKLTMTDQDGWTCLHWAAFHGNATAAAILIAEQPSLASIKDKQQQTPLDIATAEKSEDVVQALKKNQ